MWCLMWRGGLLGLLLTSLAAAAPQISSPSPVHDFGRLDNRQTVEHTFVLTNRGDEELRITQVKPACGCTVATMAKKTLAPGESVDLQVQLSLKGVKGTQHKEIAVVSNDPHVPRLVLLLQGQATSPISVTPSHLLFGEVSPSQTKGDVAVSSSQTFADQAIAGTDPSLIKSVMLTTEDDLALQVTHAQILPRQRPGEAQSDAQWHAWVAASTDEAGDAGMVRINVQLLPGATLGQTQATVRLHTDHVEFPYIDLPVSAVIAGEISYSPQSIVLMEQHPSPVTRYVLVTRSRLDEDMDFQILKVTPPLPEIAVEVRAVGKRGYRIKLQDLIPTPDMQGKKIVIETNIASMRRIEIPVRVLVDGAQAAAK